MNSFYKNKYAYVTKSSTNLSIIVGIIIAAYGIYILNDFIGAIILGFGLGMIFFSSYEILYSKKIKENKDINFWIKTIDFNDYIPVNKYNIILSIIIGLILVYIGLIIVKGTIGMIIFGFGVDLTQNIIRLIYRSEKNPLF